MEPKIFCQSCTMPIDNIADRGTEKDGSKSSEYCKYCYQNGALINPNMTFEEMKSLVISQMKKMNLPPGIIENSIKSLPYLKRWRSVHAQKLL
ncbi:MAG TPA: zinc ribbon domain-containing protein [Chitinophagaceae bacterium]